MRASGWALGLLPLLLLLPGAEGQIQVCSVSPDWIEVYENVLPTQAVATITAPPEQEVVLSPTSNLIFEIENRELRLIREPDYETDPVLTANLECKEGNIVVTKLTVTVVVLNVNDEPPLFPFSSKTWNVSENTNVGTTVIPATELTATDKDGDTLFYTLLGQSPPGADKVFSLAGVNSPALQLAQALDYDKMPSMVFHLLVRDTPEPEAEPSHTATASITIQVVPADMRPPWFLPCQYNDGRVCIHAQYLGTVPVGFLLTTPFTFFPGPVYAVDGDTAINEPIRYSIIQGNENNTFQIGEDSGNVTMTKAVPIPTIFHLLVQARQVHTGSYSVTQVTIEVMNNQHPPRFTRALYRGWLPPDTRPNVAVKDEEDPARLLTLSAEDLDFPPEVPNWGLEYRITNSSAFRMSGEVVLTSAPVGPPGVLYLEAEVLDRQTREKDTTTIQVLIQPTPPGGSSGDKTQRRFTASEMGATGGVLGALLFLTLILLGVFVYKYYRGPRESPLSSKPGTDPKDSGYENKAFQAQEAPDGGASPSPSPEPEPLPRPPTGDSPRGSIRSLALPMPDAEVTPPAVREPEEKAEAQGRGSTREKPMRSILTKERKSEGGGYKAVWFGEDIGAQVDVVVINSPAPEEPHAESQEPTAQPSQGPSPS
ncbi:cadherin-related family member 5 isoform X2 [Antechinus flavipes]|uniref:cadherin-related family member 5 isoform X2 n=1 Tax=Antechinus flavipes TaxID=38775 RepID=UPI00223557CF|nr:cadherin-related family member 5 isoform X2 [Antechinus flavipes]